MPSLAVPSLRAVAATVLLAASARAQSSSPPALSHLDDAAPIPAGMLRIRLANAWTRFDQRFAAGGGTTPLGAALSVDSLGTAQLPLLQPIEAGLRTMASDPALHLSLGQLRVGSNARIVTTPITLEYGVTRRLSVGLLIPIVETRRVAQAVVSGDSTHANVGFVPATSRTAAATQNAAIAAAFRKAADSLAILVTRCPTSPAAAGCAAVNANPSDAAAAGGRAQNFADAVAKLGTTAATALVAPRTSSDLFDTLEARRVQLNARLAQYLGAGAGATTSIFSAPTDFSYRDLQGNRGDGSVGLLGGPLGGGLDSIHTTERIGFGDIAVGARFLLLDQFERDASPRRIQTRLAIGGALRFATSRTDSAQSLVDIPTGDGAGVDLNSTGDMIVGHFAATIGARYGKSVGRTVQVSLSSDPEAPFPTPQFGPRTRTAGDVLGLDVTPRLLLTEWLALDGHYGLERLGGTTYGPATFATGGGCIDTCTITLPATTTASRTTQRLGFGFRYSTVDAYARGHATYPVEVSFARLQTVTGDPGVEKQTRDQIEVRLFYQILRRP